MARYALSSVAVSKPRWQFVVIRGKWHLKGVSALSPVPKVGDTLEYGHGVHRVEATVTKVVPKLGPHLPMVIANEIPKRL